MAPGLNVRTRVHEYGGGAWAVRDGVIVFSEFDDNRLLLKRTPDAVPEELVTDPALRFADLEIDAARDRVVAVVEDQHQSAIEARNLLVGVSLADGSLTELATGHDFYSDPRLSPDGARLAWLTWDFPQMPWDGTDLWVAPLAADGTLGEAVHVAGGPTESVIQPKWAPDGSLVFVSDRSAWWNLYRWDSRAGRTCRAGADGREIGGPPWVFGLSDYDIDDDGTHRRLRRRARPAARLFRLGRWRAASRRIGIARDAASPTSGSGSDSRPTPPARRRCHGARPLDLTAVPRTRLREADA